MAGAYADPTSIDYVLQRAQEELRRGESQHHRSTEVQCTNHVKELLGNLERYLETCGVQLPAEVITGAEASAAAMAAAMQEANAQRDAARSSLSVQLGGSTVGNKFSAFSPAGRLGAAGVPGSARELRRPPPVHGSASIHADGSPARVGWVALATPTDSHQLSQSGEENRRDFTAAIRRVKSEPIGAGLLTSLGSNDVPSPVSPLPGREAPAAGRLASTRPSFALGTSGAAAAPYHARVHTPVRSAGPPSPHSPPGAGTANPTVAPLDATPMQEGYGSSNGVMGGGGSPPLVRIGFRTPHAEALGQSGTVRTASPNGVSATAAVARSLSVHAPPIGSGNDKWGDFGQFVQSITESKLNSNLTSLQSAAAAGFAAPGGYFVGNGIPVHSAPPAAVFAVTAAPPVVVPEKGFQLPHVLTTGAGGVSPSGKDLPLSSMQQPALQSPLSFEGMPSPFGISSGASLSAPPPDSRYVRDASTASSQRPPTSAAEITSISSHSPSIPLQAAYGAGSNAVRALANADEVVAGRPPQHGSPPPTHAWATPSKEAGRPLNGAAAVDHVPSPPQHPRSAEPLASLQAAAKIQRAASLPVVSYLPYGHGGSPYYPHILRISTNTTPSNPTTLQSSPTLLASNRSPVSSPTPLSNPPDPQQPEKRLMDDSSAASLPHPPGEDNTGAVVVRSREKEMLMRRLRGILDKSPSQSASQPESVRGGDGGQEGVTALPGGKNATVAAAAPPCVVTVAMLSTSAHRVHDGTAHPTSNPYTPSVRSPLQDEHSLQRHAPASLSDNEKDDTATTHSSSNMRGSTGVFTTGESWGAMRSLNSTKMNPQLRTPSSKDMGSLPTGLYSASRRTLLSHDPSVAGLSSGTRPPAAPPQQPARHRHDSSSAATSTHDDASSRPGEGRASYTTAHSTAAPTFAASTTAPAEARSVDGNGYTYSPPDALMAGESRPSDAAADLALADRARRVTAQPHSAWMRGGSDGVVDVDAPPMMHVNGYRHPDEHRNGFAKQPDASSRAPWSAPRPEPGSKHLLMQRLRMVLSRPDD